MPLLMGSRLGPYEILAPIGAGGMGEVYRARDSKLGRDVAVKVLPDAVARDAQRMGRFEREAKLLASLNHPNIATIHGLEDSSGSRALVMELVEGPTLADRIREGAIPVPEALPIAKQIADALEYAHERGIVHRDLKPSNIKIARHDSVKILDFGLAKAVQGEAGAMNISEASTITETATETGVLLGTAAYMSPEQAKGKPVDRRADIWAFGCVLFEMLTGRQAFRGQTFGETLAHVLEAEPGWTALPSALPMKIRDLLRRCLQKDPRNRLRDIGDARIEIEEYLHDPAGAKSLTGAESSNSKAAAGAIASKHYAWLPWALVALLVVALGSWVVASRSQRSDQNPLSNAQFTRLTDFEGAQMSPAISPDGKFVAFISDRSGKFDIWLAQANEGSLVNLTHGRINDARAPVRAVGFSGDGSEVWDGGTPDKRLTLWPLVGGAPHNFLDERAAEVAWSPDNSHVVYHTWEPGDPLFVADRNGANPRLILRNEPGLHNHYPTWSLDGRWIYFVRGRPATREMDLWRISPDGGDPEQLTHLNTDVESPAPIDDRTVLFIAPGANGAGPWLWAFDTATRTSRRVSSGLEQYTAVASAADGKHLVASVVNARVGLWSVPITNRVIEEKEVASFPLPTTRAQAPRFGGTFLFYLSSRDGADGLWVFRDGQAQEIWNGSEGVIHTPPAVSSNGASVAFALTRNGKQQMDVIAADGTGLRALSNDVDVRGSASWSPDGKWIVVAGADRRGPGLFKMPSDGGAPVRLATGTFLDPVWSPHGDLIVYCGTQVFSLNPLLAIHPDGTPVKMPLINVQRDGERARFLPDGSGLIYMLGSTLAGQDFWLLDLRTMQSRRLTHLNNAAVMRTFDVTPDGKRIVFDRLRENSDILLIDLAAKQSGS